MIFLRRFYLLVPVDMNGIELPEGTNFLLLGLTFTPSMDWKPLYSPLPRLLQRK